MFLCHDRNPLISFAVNIKQACEGNRMMLWLTRLNLSCIMRQLQRTVPTPDPSKSQVQEPGGWCRGSHSWTWSLQWALEFSWNPDLLYFSVTKLGRRAKFKSGVRPILTCTHTFEAGTPTTHLHTKENGSITRGRETRWKSTAKSVTGLCQPSKYQVPQRQPDPEAEAGCLGPTAYFFYNRTAFIPLLVLFLNRCCLCLVLSKFNGYLKSSMKIITEKVC